MKTQFGLDATTSDCPRCGAPRGLMGWMCGHNGNIEHDRDEDAFWENWNNRVNKKQSTSSHREE